MNQLNILQHTLKWRDTVTILSQSRAAMNIHLSTAHGQCLQTANATKNHSTATNDVTSGVTIDGRFFTLRGVFGVSFETRIATQCWQLVDSCWRVCPVTTSLSEHPRGKGNRWNWRVATDRLQFDVHTPAVLHYINLHYMNRLIIPIFSFKFHYANWWNDVMGGINTDRRSIGRCLTRGTVPKIWLVDSSQRHVTSSKDNHLSQKHIH